MPLFKDATVNRIPDQGHWIFQTWKIDPFCLTLFELSISDYAICVFVRTGKRVFKWEYARKYPLRTEDEDE
jgi:hypothetical protein